MLALKLLFKWNAIFYAFVSASEGYYETNHQHNKYEQGNLQSEAQQAYPPRN